jgi:hypothetical protein
MKVGRMTTTLVISLATAVSPAQARTAVTLPVPHEAAQMVVRSYSNVGLPMTLVDIARPSPKAQTKKAPPMPEVRSPERTPSLKRSLLRGLARATGGHVEPRIADSELSDLEVALLNIAAVSSRVERRLDSGR